MVTWHLVFDVLLLQEREDQVAAREANLKSTRDAVAAQQGAAQVRSSDDAHTVISTH